MAALAVMAGLLIFTGCGDERANGKTSNTMAGFHPEQFPDIPLPRSGYQLDPAFDQLALTTGGGLVRRFEVAMIQRENAPKQTPADLLGWYRRDLAATGWNLIESDETSQFWRKDQDELRFETGRSSGRTTIRLRLRPAK